jgi:hypothetical protein
MILFDRKRKEYGNDRFVKLPGETMKPGSIKIGIGNVIIEPEAG